LKQKTAQNMKTAVALMTMAMFALSTVAVPSAHAANASNDTITLKIKHVYQTEDPDKKRGQGNGDYYAIVSIDGIKHPATKRIESANFYPKDWIFTQNVNAGQKSVIPIHIELWDKDKKHDDRVDINPSEKKETLDLRYDLKSKRWSGDVNWPIPFAEGEHGIHGSASIRFEITSTLSDRDNDGTPDYKDDCPTKKGSQHNHGCPIARPELSLPPILENGYDTPLLVIKKDSLEKIMKNTIDYAISGKAKWKDRGQTILSKSTESSNALHFDLNLKIPIPILRDQKVRISGDLVPSCEKNTNGIELKAVNVKTKAGNKILRNMMFGIADIIDRDISKYLESKLRFSTGALPLCPIFVIDSYGNIQVYSPYSPIDAVTVKIKNIIQIADPDRKGGQGNGDYYAIISIDGSRFHTSEIESTNFDPNWTFTQNVNAGQKSVIPIHIELWDNDRKRDDHIDINPSKSKKSLDLRYDLKSKKWTGDVKYPTTIVQGNNGEHGVARMTFEITSESLGSPIQKVIRDLLPFKLNLPILPDWNNKGKGNPDKGDPLVFSMTDKPVNVIRNWAAQHESFLTEFDLYDIGENVTLSRTLDDGTMTLFLDLNGDGKLSDGTEWLYDQNKNVYQILSQPLIDSNQNGWFDYSDDLWNIAMVKDGDKYYTASDLGIVAFNWSNHFKGHGDMFGENRQYADCLYEGKYHYPDCKAVGENNFPITAYNQNSILLNDGRTLDSFGSVMGHLDMSENSNTSDQKP